MNFLDSNKKEIQSLIALSENKDHTIKIEFKTSKKKNSLLEEAGIVSYLNNNKCVSSPKIIEFGTKKLDKLKINKFSNRFRNIRVYIFKV